jgi:branched-chain amino acid transport system ATP-binding protein
VTGGVSVLSVEGIGKSFGGVQAVRGVSFAVAAGEMLALIGANGAGKTTCFNMLGGQIRPDRGQVRLEGRDVTGFAPRRLCRLGVGRTFQITATFASMSVRENVQTALTAHHRRSFGWWRAADGQFGAEADALLAQVALGAQAHRPACVLAYGDLKRLELAMALAAAPILLLMDEPTAGMAGDARQALMHLVRRLATQHGIAVLFTEHDMDVVFGCADRVLVMDHGALIAQGPPDAVRADAAVRAVYLGSAGTGGADAAG